MEYCETTDDLNIKGENDCDDCQNEIDPQEVCGIRKDGEGFLIRIFENECQLLKHNCELNVTFKATGLYICNGMKIDIDNETKNVDEEYNNEMDQGNEKDVSNDNDQKIYEGNETDVINYNENKTHDGGKSKIKNLVVVDGSMIDRDNINASIDNFFASTHVFDLPMQEMQLHLNESTRRMLIKVAGPLKIFEPWVVIPKNISDDYQHRPTLSSCYHKCPVKCPETYAPVCGRPGNMAREPSLVFKNHCFMDVAQCKMFWEDKSYTAASSAYQESSFLFCLGDQMNSLFRFLPLIRTLQHMGRLKKKGKFRYKIKNMRFFNNLLSREPSLMG